MTTDYIAPKVQIANDVDVWIQDQATIPFHRYLMSEEKTDISLISGATKGDYNIYVNSGHGFTTGDAILLLYGDVQYQCLVASGNTNKIILGIPLPVDFPVDGTQIIRGSIEMNVNGSVTPVVFYCRIGAHSAPIDIQNIGVYMEDNATGDDSLYGALPALTKGSLARYHSDNGDFNLGLFIKNGMFIQKGATGYYTDKAGGGNFSMKFLIDLKQMYGIVMRLDNNNNSYLSFTVNDNLTGLIEHRVAVFGQTTLGET